MGILIWLLSGLIAGWLTGQIMRGRGFGIVGDIVVGLLGGFIGGYLAGFVGIQPTNWIGNILVAVAGGVILVVLLRTIR